MKPKYHIICAVSQNNVIGVNGRLPWNLPEDISRFKRITRGHTIVMGRKTFESIGKRLIGRKNVVITSDPNFSATEVVVVRSIEETKKMEGKIFYIGGEDVFKEALEFADVMFLTRVHQTVVGDAFFPTTDLSDYLPMCELDRYDNGVNYSFINLTRKGYNNKDGGHT